MRIYQPHRTSQNFSPRPPRRSQTATNKTTCCQWRPHGAVASVRWERDPRRAHAATSSALGGGGGGCSQTSLQPSTRSSKVARHKPGKTFRVHESQLWLMLLCHSYRSFTVGTLTAWSAPLKCRRPPSSLMFRQDGHSTRGGAWGLERFEAYSRPKSVASSPKGLPQPTPDMTHPPIFPSRHHRVP